MGQEERGEGEGQEGEGAGQEGEGEGQEEEGQDKRGRGLSFLTLSRNRSVEKFGVWRECRR